MMLFDCLRQGLAPRKRIGIGDVAWAAGIGMAAGFLAGLLLAPETGKEMREAVVRNTRNVASKVKHSLMDNENNVGPTEQEGVQNGSSL